MVRQSVELEVPASLPFAVLDFARDAAAYSVTQCCNDGFAVTQCCNDGFTVTQCMNDGFTITQCMGD
jgi:hypothetical protein